MLKEKCKHLHCCPFLRLGFFFKKKKKGKSATEMPRLIFEVRIQHPNQILM